MNGILLLDQTYKPIRVISVQRAVCLLLAGNAEGLADEFIPMRSASSVVNVPVVLRLSYAVKLPFRKSEVPCTRRGVLVRDNHECQFITAKGPCETTATTIDHVFPKSKGGARLSWDNLVASCAAHNHKKSDRTLSEMGWTLKREPTVPRGSVRLSAANVPESWVPWIQTA